MHKHWCNGEWRPHSSLDCGRAHYHHDTPHMISDEKRIQDLMQTCGYDWDEAEAALARIKINEGERTCMSCQGTGRVPGAGTADWMTEVTQLHERIRKLEAGIRDVLVETDVCSLTYSGVVHYICQDCQRTPEGRHEEGCIWGMLSDLLESP